MFQSEPIRVMLADDHPVVRAGIRHDLESHPDITVVGEAGDGQEALRKLELLQPDVLLLDISMPGSNALDVMAELQRRKQPPRVLILSAYCDPEHAAHLMAAGASGYLLKEDPAAEIASGIRGLMADRPVLSPGVQRLLLRRRRSVLQHELTEREVEILQLVARGYADKEIGTTCGIRIGTVRNHLANIYPKLPGVNTRAEAVAWAWREGIVQRRTAVT